MNENPFKYRLKEISRLGSDQHFWFNFLFKYIIGGALRPRLYGKLFRNVHSPDGHVRNPEAGLNIILYSDWL